MSTIVAAVGDIIDARCTKCQSVTNHVIVAMVAAKPAKVTCNTCSGTHRYRSPTAVPRVTKSAGSTPAVKAEEWSELRAAMNNIAAKDYDMDAGYRVGAVIKHSSFGLGLVQRVVGNRKMEILFEEGKKTLRCK